MERDYTLDELEDYVYYYDVPTDRGKNAPVLAHFYYPKGSLYPDELDVVWEEDLVRVAKEKETLLNFVRTVAEGKMPSASEATKLLSKVNEKDFF